MTRLRILVASLALSALLSLAPAVAPAQELASPNKPAALIDFPYIVVDTANGLDTAIQITNIGTVNPVNVLCFYENANRHCTSFPNNVCKQNSDCASFSCVQDYSYIDFAFMLTPGQPVAFKASAGLSALPCSPPDPRPCVAESDGIIVATPEDPFVGRLSCLAVAGLDVPELFEPVETNVLRGTATVTRFQTSPERLDAATYGGIGFAAVAGANDGDMTLDLQNEYDACPWVNLVTHAFENAVDPINASSRVFTRLALAPCSRDPFENNLPGKTTLEYLVFNEFEQRLVVKGGFSVMQTLRLSEIHPLAWDVGLQGTFSGQTRIRTITDNPVVAVAIEEREPVANPTRISSAAMNVQGFGVQFPGSTVIGAAATGVCGNGSLEPGEQCDDGDTDSGDGCAADCLTEPCYICDPVCQPLAGYQGGFGQVCNQSDGSLLIRDSTNPQRDVLQWRYDGLTSANGEGFDNPVLATDYTLCLFDGGDLVMKLPVAHDGQCGGADCWKDTRSGFRYRNRATNADGVAVLRLGNDDPGSFPQDEGFAVLEARGLNLSLPGPLASPLYFQGPVRSVLVKHAGEECWEVDHSVVDQNTTTRFSAP